MSLNRLWQPQSKRAVAPELLAPISDWFTEGFETADLPRREGTIGSVEELNRACTACH